MCSFVIGEYKIHIKQPDKQGSHTSKLLSYFFYVTIRLIMLNLTFLFESFGKTEIQFIQLCKDILCLLRIVEGFGTKFESCQPAHPYCLTCIYTDGCSDSYCDIPKIYIDSLKIWTSPLF